MKPYPILRDLDRATNGAVRRLRRCAAMMTPAETRLMASLSEQLIGTRELLGEHESLRAIGFLRLALRLSPEYRDIIRRIVADHIPRRSGS